VLSIVDQSIDPDPIELRTDDTPEQVAPPAITTRTDLELALANSGLPLEEDIADSIIWFEQLGFVGELKLFGVSTANSLAAGYARVPTPQLLSMAGAGDIGAAQALAEISLNGSDNPNPAEAIEWYRQAASLGSVYAMFRLGELLDIFSDPQLDNFRSDSLYSLRINTLREENPLIRRDALAWTMTALLAGGLPVAQDDVGVRIKRLSDELGETGTSRACDKAGRLLLDLAAERRMRGGLVFSLEPPRLFVSVPDMKSILPCGSLEPIISINDCDIVPVPGLVNPNQKLWRCES